MSTLHKLIPPEIRDDALYNLIKRLAATEQLATVLEIGSSAGGGSTEAFVAGLSQNPGKPKLFCIEVSKIRFEKLRETYAPYPFVHCYNRSSVTEAEFPSPQTVRQFYHDVASGLRKFPLEQVLGWLEHDVQYVREEGVEAGAIEAIKAEHGIDTFDLVLIDGSEFTGEVEYEKVEGARLVVLDDTNTFKCWRVRERLLADPMYDVIADDQTLRNGYAAFRKRPTPRLTGDVLPIHFFTIVLNGEPFIRYHERVLCDLRIPWHWHVVEGVAALKHDTAWSVAAGGRVADSLHDRGRSNDGTSSYLDDLAARFPDNVSIYRKPPGTFWDGKLEMVNAPLPNIKQDCLLWQIDSDELWTVEQIHAVHSLFTAAPERSAAYYWCWYYVGPRKVISTRYNYGQNPRQEWLRTWRWKVGAKWATHEPPTLVAPDPGSRGQRRDIAKINPFTHDEMERAGAVFQHLAYVTEKQLAFREIYYGYKGAEAAWRELQKQQAPGLLKDYFAWVSDGTVFDDVSHYFIDPVATLDEGNGSWRFDPRARWSSTGKLPSVRRPRVVIDGLFWQYLRSGIGRVWENILREWVASKFIDHVVLLDRDGTAPRIPGVHYWSMPRHSYRDTGHDSLLLDEVCQRLQANLFASTYYSCTSSVPSFFVGYDMIPEVLGFALDDEAWQEKRRAILHAAGHSMISQNSATDLERSYPELTRGGTYVTHVGVDPAFTRPSPDAIAAFRSRQDLAHKPYLLMVGERIGHGGYKNGALAFRAIAELPVNFATLVCIGGHQEIEPELRRLAPKHDIRRLSLADQELRLAYAGAHALLYPSKYEGFGMPPLEAMACGAPAIVCRNSSLPEVVDDTALFVAEDDPLEMVKAIERLFDPAVRAQLMARGELQAKKFTFEKMAKTLAAALVETHQKLLAGKIAQPSAAWAEMRTFQKACQLHGLHVHGQGAKRPVSLGTGIGLGSELDRLATELASMRKSPFWKARELTIGALKKAGLRARS